MATGVPAQRITPFSVCLKISVGGLLFTPGVTRTPGSESGTHSIEHTRASFLRSQEKSEHVRL